MSVADGSCSNAEIISAMLLWWNEAFELDAMTPAGFARFFTDDAAFIVNGDLRGKGPEALAAFFNPQNQGVGTAVMILPFLKTFSTGEYIFFEYDMHIGAEIHNAKGYARIEGERIAFYEVNKFRRGLYQGSLR